MGKKKKTLIIDIEPYRSTIKIKNKIIQKKLLPSLTNSEIIKEIEMIIKILKETPDIREKKVAALREAIRKGTYVVNSRKIAEKLISEALLQQHFRPHKRDC